MIKRDYSPARLDGVIAAGAVGDDDRPTVFSTRGEHVALSAPGDRIVTAGLDGYTAQTGTSFAAPFVAAAAGLLVSRAARRSQPLTGGDVRRLLTATARPFARTGERGCGAGILDAHAALVALDEEIDQTLSYEQQTETSDTDAELALSY
jgi:subtilisin family serine protease